MNISPLMKQFSELKERYPGTILLFRIGDFYEAFEEHADIISEVLGIVKIKRNYPDGTSSISGFPHHRIDDYLGKLVRAGYKVALVGNDKY